MLSPMRLDKAWLEEMVIEAAPPKDAIAEEQTYSVKEIDFSLEANSKHTSFRLRLSVEIVADEHNTAPGLRRVRIVVWGVFSFDEGTSQEVIQQYTPLNQLAMLYGLARGMVISATGATASGIFILPSVNFFDIVRQKKSREQIPGESLAAEEETGSTTEKRAAKKRKATKQQGT